jgi:hypothetical protein
VEVVQRKRGNARTIALQDTKGPSEQIFFLVVSKTTKEVQGFLNPVLGPSSSLFWIFNLMVLQA